jgi:hypothetical protein
VWGRPEDKTQPNPVYVLSKDRPGSDVVGAMAAALASASVIFKDADPAYSAKLLASALKAYDFARNNLGLYNNAIPDAANFYRSSNMYDDLAWAAVWLAVRTGDAQYKQQAKAWYEKHWQMEDGKGVWNNFGAPPRGAWVGCRGPARGGAAAALAAARGGWPPGCAAMVSAAVSCGARFKHRPRDCKPSPSRKDCPDPASRPALIPPPDWDSNSWGVVTFLSRWFPQDPFFKARMEGFVKDWTTGAGPWVRYTPKGLAFSGDWGSLRHVGNALFLMKAYARGTGDVALQQKVDCFAHKQMEYILGGVTGRSFVVGYGPSPPKQPHHRAASCPPLGYACTWDFFNSRDPNPHTLFGALVGGPNGQDGYDDSRNNFVQNEVATDYNGGFTGALAGLVKPSIGSKACPK